MQILKIELQLTWFIPNGGLSEGDGLLFTFLLPCFCCGLPYRCSLPTAAPSTPTRKALHTYLEEHPDLAGLLCFFRIELDFHPVDVHLFSGQTSRLNWINIQFQDGLPVQARELSTGLSSGSIRK